MTLNNSFSGPIVTTKDDFDPDLILDQSGYCSKHDCFLVNGFCDRCVAESQKAQDDLIQEILEKGVR